MLNQPPTSAPGSILLLRSALWEPSRALDCWKMYLSGQPLDDVDPYGFRWLPLVHQNLGDSLGELHGRLQGIRRFQCVKRALLEHELAGILETFKKPALPVILLSGWARCETNLRDFERLDLLMESKDLALASSLLVERGWTSPHRWMGQETSLCLRKNAWSLRLRSFANDHSRWPRVDDAWRARTRAWGELGLARVLDPTDHFIQICVDGVLFPEQAPLWTGAAWSLLQDREVDWNLLVSEARRLRLEIPLLTALDTLRQDLQAPIPGEVSRSLGKSPGWRDRLYFAWRAPSAQTNFWLDLLRNEEGRPLLDFLLRRWALSGPERLPAEIWRRGKLLCKSLLARRSYDQGQEISGP